MHFRLSLCCEKLILDAEQTRCRIKSEICDYSILQVFELVSVRYSYVKSRLATHNDKLEERIQYVRELWTTFNITLEIRMFLSLIEVKQLFVAYKAANTLIDKSLN